MTIIFILTSFIALELLFFSNCRFLWKTILRVGTVKDKISIVFWTLFIALNRYLFFIEHTLLNFILPIDIKNPVFIIGHNRSGTTKLHKNLIRHIPESISPGIIDALMPSLLLRYTLGSLMGRYLSNKTKDFKAHQVGVFENEEEDKVFFHRYKSRTWLYLFDLKVRTQFWKSSNRMTTIDEKDMRFLKNFMKRCIRIKKGNKWIGKPLLLTKNHEVHLRTFPNAKFILLLREPALVMSSYLNMSHQFSINSEEDIDILNFSKEMFLNIETIVDNHKLDQLKLVSFSELISNRNVVLKDIFNFLEIDHSEILEESHSKEAHVNDPKYLKIVKDFVVSNRMFWSRIYLNLKMY